ncbi:cytochrome P450 2U1-like [Clavelina lepadiformis]|uniref:cytochrome P450 2U1-like n=1 Tax=Clavelina lepadiformis TaxID=159417 RepID=UPI004041E149
MIMIATAVVGVFVFCLFFVWYRKPNNFPPGPRGFPLVGVAPFLGKFPEQTLAKYGEKYGNVISIRLGPKPCVVLNDLEAVTEALVKQGESFSGRPHNAIISELSQDYGITFIDSGDLWKTQRKFGLATLKKLGVGKQSMELTINEQISILMNKFKALNGKPFELKEMIRKCFANSTCVVLMGCGYPYDHPTFEAILSNLPEGLAAVTIPFLRHFPPFRKPYQRVLKKVETLRGIIKDVVEEHKVAFNHENVRDFIDYYLIEMKTNREGFKEEQLHQYIMDLLVGGIDSSVASIGWGVISLIHNPGIQEKLRKEIDQVIGDCSPSMSHEQDMPYMRAFIQENHRFKTLAELNVPHCTKNRVKIFGYEIPKGTMIFTNIWNVHNDSRVWKNPEIFNPERHLDENGKFVKSSHVIPFAVGYRSCIGKILAKFTLFLFFTNFLQKFVVLADPHDQLPSYDKDPKSTFSSPYPYPVIVKER